MTSAVHHCLGDNRRGESELFAENAEKTTLITLVPLELELMLKMSHSRKDHRDPALVGRRDHLFIAH